MPFVLMLFSVVIASQIYGLSKKDNAQPSPAGISQPAPTPIGHQEKTK
jgi:hypothetical protein